MTSLEFRFSHLHPDTAELHGDVDWLLRFVAGTFEPRVGEILVFEEVDFPVIDLARALIVWLEDDFVAKRGLVYEVPGGAREALTISPCFGGWAVDSIHRVTGGPVPGPVGGGAMRANVRAFVDDIAAETLCAYGYDVHGLLKRVVGRPGDQARRD